MSSPRLALIVAMAENRVIGIDNRLPWHLPEDLKYFRSVTIGKPIIMGRKTFDSLGRVLPGRTNIVVSRQPGLQLPGALVVESPAAALAAANAQAVQDGVDEVLLIGGAQLYAELLPQCQRLYLTEVALQPDGDAWFPALQPDDWRELSARPVAASDVQPAHCYRVLERVVSDS